MSPKIQLLLALLYDTFLVLGVWFGLYQCVEWVQVLFWVVFVGSLLVGFFCVVLSYSSALISRLKQVPAKRKPCRGFYNTCFDFALSLAMVMGGYFVLGFVWFLSSEIMKRRLRTLQSA